MTIQLTEIYNGNLNPAQIITSTVFTGGLFLFFSIDEPDNIGYDIGFSLIIQIPTIDRIEDKEIPLKTLDERIASTFDVLHIPDEISRVPFECYVAMNSGRTYENVKLLVATSNTSIDDLKEEIDKISAVQTAELALETAQALNAIAQNAALSILAGSLAPITLGTSTPAIAPLITGSQALLGAGIPLLP